jgi:hypothetical protein
MFTEEGYRFPDIMIVQTKELRAYEYLVVPADDSFLWFYETREVGLIHKTLRNLVFGCVHTILSVCNGLIVIAVLVSCLPRTMSSTCSSKRCKYEINGL